jgi:hypothetical protein
MHSETKANLWRWKVQNEREDWRALSEAVSREQDPEKLMELVERLNRALAHREVEMAWRLKAS